MAVLVISYARVDQPQVQAVVSFLRAALRQIDKAVYWDGDFEPGDPWFEQMKQYIDAAPQLFVFWCEHSAQSQQVRREFMYALERSKRVVPVLLDSTPLSPELAPIHGIDLRRAIAHALQIRAPTASRFNPLRLVFSHAALVGAALAVIVVAGTFLLSSRNTHLPAFPTSQTTTTTPVAPGPPPLPVPTVGASPAWPLLSLVVTVGIVGTLLALVLWLGRTGKMSAAKPPDRADVEVIVKQFARYF